MNNNKNYLTQITIFDLDGTYSKTISFSRLISLPCIKTYKHLSHEGIIWDPAIHIDIDYHDLHLLNGPYRYKASIVSESTTVPTTPPLKLWCLDPSTSNAPKPIGTDKCVQLPTNYPCTFMPYGVQSDKNCRNYYDMWGYRCDNPENMSGAGARCRTSTLTVSSVSKIINPSGCIPYGAEETGNQGGLWTSTQCNSNAKPGDSSYCCGQPKITCNTIHPGWSQCIPPTPPPPPTPLPSPPQKCTSTQCPGGCKVGWKCGSYDQGKNWECRYYQPENPDAMWCN